AFTELTKGSESRPLSKKERREQKQKQAQDFELDEITTSTFEIDQPKDWKDFATTSNPTTKELQDQQKKAKLERKQQEQQKKQLELEQKSLMPKTGPSPEEKEAKALAKATKAKETREKLELLAQARKEKEKERQEKLTKAMVIVRDQSKGDIDKEQEKIQIAYESSLNKPLIKQYEFAEKYVKKQKKAIDAVYQYLNATLGTITPNLDPKDFKSRVESEAPIVLNEKIDFEWDIFETLGNKEQQKLAKIFAKYEAQQYKAAVLAEDLVNSLKVAHENPGQFLARYDQWVQATAKKQEAKKRRYRVKRAKTELAASITLTQGSTSSSPGES
ncbi:MAG: hypothetical protein RLZ12_761, partial [Bacillota bacterium]